MDAVVTAARPFDPDDHPRNPSGPQGGQFTTSSTSGDQATPVPRGNITYSGKLRPIHGIRTKHNYKRPGGGGGRSSTPAAPATPTATLKRGNDNDPAAVQQLQALIGELGLGAIAVDGTFGPETENAVKAAQVKLGLKPTGSASSMLQRRLHDAHTLSPCIDRAQSKVTASAVEYEESDEDELDGEDEYEDLDDEEGDEGADGEPVTAAAGRDVTPGHDELHHYWTRGEGLAKWADSPTPWTTLVAHLTKYVGPLKAKTFASRWYIEVFGFSAGSDKARVAHGKPPRGHLIGPG